MSSGAFTPVLRALLLPFSASWAWMRTQEPARFWALVPSAPPAVLPRPLCEGLIGMLPSCSAPARPSLKPTVQLGSLCLSGNLAPPLGWPLTCLTTASSASSLLWPAENSSVTGFCTLRL